MKKNKLYKTRGMLIPVLQFCLLNYFPATQRITRPVGLENLCGGASQIKALQTLSERLFFCSERRSYSACGFVILVVGCFTIQKPFARFAPKVLFSFCPYKSKLLTAKTKKALQTASVGFSFVARGRIELPTS